MTRAEIQQLFESKLEGKTVYLVGCSGVGMAGLAHLLLDRGVHVIGADLVWNERTRALVERGAVLHRGHEEAHLTRQVPDLVIYSSAIPQDNPELATAARMGIPTLRRAAFLAAVLATQRSVCVVGMHGKTTTSSLLAFVLKELDRPTNYAVGGDVPQLVRPAAYQAVAETGEDAIRPWFVAEVDESDGGLGRFDPVDSIVLNLDSEHLDYFVSVDRIRSEFAAFIERTQRGVVYCADDAVLASMKGTEAVSFGYHPLADYRIELKPFDAAQPSIERFVLWHEGRPIGPFTLQLPGRANVSNAAAVITWLLLQGIDDRQIASALAKFRGVERRQDVVFVDSRYRLIDDYAHHPTEIRETIQAVKRYTPQRLVVVFQPHRYTRTERLIEQYARCFGEADAIWLTEIHAAHETPIPGVSGQALAEAVQAEGRSVEYEASLDRLRERLTGELKSGDLVLFMGAGAITQVAHQMAAALRADTTTVKPEFLSALRDGLGPGSQLRLQEPLAKRTTLRVGGPAEVFLEPASIADLSVALEAASEFEVPVFVLGRGSNLLIRDQGIRGLVLSLAQPGFSEVLVQGDRLICGAGARLRAIASEARRVGLTGLEFLEGIPGTLGGALRMNAGAMGAWMFDVVERVRFVDYAGKIHERPTKELYVEYRGCPLLKSHLAVEAVLRGTPSTEASVRERMGRFSSKRWESQPAAPSAGCIFKNPGEMPAGKLIDDLGLKGTRVGGAAVSDVHGNFIVNEGGATADDVLKLIELVRNRARRDRGIDLKTEVQIVGG